jgi:hypothetical protein
MPEFDLARLAHDLNAMRRGHGPRRVELRERLAAIDPRLRHARNLENMKLSGIKARLRSLDSRLDPAPLQAAAEESAQRLAVLDRRLLEAIAARKK